MWKLKKARASQAGPGGTQQPGTIGMPKSGETLTRNTTRPRPEGSTPTKRVRPPKRPRECSGPGTYKEALTNIRIAIFKENHPENTLTENEQDHILEAGKGVSWNSKRTTATPEVLQAGGGTLMYVYDKQSDQCLIRATGNHTLE
jgi:hypothetical protein